MKRWLLILVLLSSVSCVNAQLQFVHLSDLHVGSGTGADDLRRSVSDINANDSVQFVVITGDITEFGADNEEFLAKQILDSLNKPWHIIPGNHDGTWSESGANTFKRVFGNETFSFVAGGYHFLGTNCGPNIRMGPGQIPRENIVWLDSILKTIPDATPIIFLNHYPLDDQLNNWYDAIDLLKKKNIQLVLCGHGHSNRKLNFEGIPAVMGRSNLRAKDAVGGYNIVSINNGDVSYRERTPAVKTGAPWTALKIGKLANANSSYARPSYKVNDSFPPVKEMWLYQDKSDIGSGTAGNDKMIFTTNANGELVALNAINGKLMWKFRTGGKIYALPAVAGDVIITASSDNNVYGVKAGSGKMIWKVKAHQAVLGNPLVKNGVVYIGSSDGIFRAINVKDGKVKWEFDGVAGFVVSKPLIYGNKIFFGCWNNDFYALDLNTGSLIWKWNNQSGNRMYSPAAVWPVAVNNRVFIVAPDRYMTCLDAGNGKVIWRKQMPDQRVRESMGLSLDSSIVYAKTMDGAIIGVSTIADEMRIDWKAKVELGYEICPTPIIEKNGIVYVATGTGVVAAIERTSGNVKWKHKISNCMVTHILPLHDGSVVATTMDGKVVKLKEVISVMNN